jgi:hypothetical protein
LYHKIEKKTLIQLGEENNHLSIFLYHKIEKKTLIQLGEENNVEGAFTLGVR